MKWLKYRGSNVRETMEQSYDQMGSGERTRKNEKERKSDEEWRGERGEGPKPEVHRVSAECLMYALRERLVGSESRWPLFASGL
jgi:hypothetical protein